MREKLGETGLLTDDTRKIVCFDENGREYRGENDGSKRVIRYRVDGYWPTELKKCDFALGLPSQDCIYFIELKGMDLKHAANQILDTISKFKEKLEEYRVHGRIVLSRVSRPDLRSSIVIRLERELARRGGELKRESIRMVERL